MIPVEAKRHMTSTAAGQHERVESEYCRRQSCSSLI